MHERFAAIACLALGMLAPAAAQAQCLNPFDPCCWGLCGPGCPGPCGPGCGAPAPDCGCPLPAPPPPMPVTVLTPQQFTTFCDVPRTTLRREAFTQTVPVTSYRQVTVDEGGFQMVWVPRLVNRTIPQTCYQQQVAYRDVPVTTLERVPVTQTRLVPQTVFGCGPSPAPFADCCESGGLGAPLGMPGMAPFGAAPFNAAPFSSTPPAAFPPINPGTGGDPPLPISSPSAQAPAYNPPGVASPGGPVPPPRDAGGQPTGGAAADWSTIQRRAAFFEQEFGYRPFGRNVRRAAYSSAESESAMGHAARDPFAP